MISHAKYAPDVGTRILDHNRSSVADTARNAWFFDITGAETE
jgi:hypothetical protein